MAPNKGSAKGPSVGGAKGPKPSLSSTTRVSKSSKKDGPKRPPPKEQKTKPRTAQENLKKKKKRVYTEKELDLPELNQITPVGVVKPKGKKKGKTFVDDQVLHSAPKSIGKSHTNDMDIGGHDDNPRNCEC